MTHQPTYPLPPAVEAYLSDAQHSYHCAEKYKTSVDECNCGLSALRKHAASLASQDHIVVANKMATGAQEKKLWLWKNFVNGNPEYWVFDNPYPCYPNGDPMTLGEPCGYAIEKQSTNGGRDRSDEDVIYRIKAANKRPAISEDELDSILDAALYRNEYGGLDLNNQQVITALKPWLNLKGEGV